MSIGSSLQQVVDAIASFERNGTDVTSIETRESDLSPGADLTVQFSTSEQLFDGGSVDEGVSFSIDDATINSGGVLRLDVTATTAIDKGDPKSGADTAPKTESIPDVASRADGGERTSAEQQTADDTEPSRDENPEALRAVYQEYDSFRQMRDALDSEVTPETIRRRMISHGIHAVPSDEEDELASDESEADDSGAETSPLSKSVDENATAESEEFREAALPDGGFATDLSIEEVIEVVQSSNTVYEAHQQLGIDQDRTRQLLRKLGLIDLVTGRLATLEDQTVTRDEIEYRIRTTWQSTKS